MDAQIPCGKGGTFRIHSFQYLKSQFYFNLAFTGFDKWRMDVFCFILVSKELLKRQKERLQTISLPFTFCRESKRSVFIFAFKVVMETCIKN